MSQPLFIGIDIGTQGTKTVLCTADGNVISEAFMASILIRPDDNTVYEDANRIFTSVLDTIKETIEKSGVSGKDIQAIGIDGQMAGIMGINSNFDAVTYFDSWLDNRCSKYTELVKKEVGNDCIKLSGGQIINAHSSKILWWKNEQPDAYKKIEKFVMPNGYVAGKLCGLKSNDAFIDYTFLHFNNFSDNLNLRFNNEMLSLFGVESKKMPKIVSPDTIIGKVAHEYAEYCGLSEDTLVIAGCGDTAASSLGAGITAPGLAYDVAGTASVFACCTDEFTPDIENKTILFSRNVVDGLFMPLAYVSGGGLTLKWFSSLVSKDLKYLDSVAAEIPIGSNGITFIPHFSGRTCPLDTSVTGAFLGLTQQSDEKSMYRAILESLACEYSYYFGIIRKCGCIKELSAIYGVGGGAKSKVFSKIKADVLGSKYLIAENVCSAPTAMAKLAAYATINSGASICDIFKPDDKNVICVDYDIKRTDKYRAVTDRYINALNHIEF